MDRHGSALQSYHDHKIQPLPNAIERHGELVTIPCVEIRLALYQRRCSGGNGSRANASVRKVVINKDWPE